MGAQNWSAWCIGRGSCVLSRSLGHLFLLPKEWRKMMSAGRRECHLCSHSFLLQDLGMPRMGWWPLQGVSILWVYLFLNLPQEYWWRGPWKGTESKEADSASCLIKCQACYMLSEAVLPYWGCCGPKEGKQATQWRLVSSYKHLYSQGQEQAALRKIKCPRTRLVSYNLGKWLSVA